MADTITLILDNRRARFEFALHESFEAGMVLLGSEVKSLRKGQANLQEAWVQLKPDGAYLFGLHISPYAWATIEQHEATRPRKLLLHPPELAKLRKGTREKGLTIVPVKLYFKGSWAKVEIALAKGKKLHDKRESIKEREVKRSLARIV